MIANGILAVVVVVALIWAWIDNTKPGLIHMNKLGVVTGKSLDDIIEIIGPSNSQSSNINNSTTHQWIIPGVHLVLLFDSNNICLGITHQFVAYRG